MKSNYFIIEGFDEESWVSILRYISQNYKL